jgi:hypothetical protein
MKGMQDTGVSSLETDTAYFSPRQPTDDLGLYLSSIAGACYQGRDFCCTEQPSEALTTFLSRKPGQDGKRAKKLDPGNCCCYDNAAFPFEISAHPVDHSIFGAVAYILRGETTVAYTGDFRLHGKKEESTREFISQAKDASVLITEGTRAGPSEEEKTSERSVCEACRESVESSSGLVIADFSPRNFERLEPFQEIAAEFLHAFRLFPVSQAAPAYFPILQYLLSSIVRVSGSIFSTSGLSLVMHSFSAKAAIIWPIIKLLVGSSIVSITLHSKQIGHSSIMGAVFRSP